LNLHTLAEFVLFEKFHLILSPLTIAVAAIYLIQRALRRRMDTLDRALLVLTVFATITQRTAFGRAEIRHQYFAAFLLGPMLVLLAVQSRDLLWLGYPVVFVEQAISTFFRPARDAPQGADAGAPGDGAAARAAAARRSRPSPARSQRRDRGRCPSPSC